MWKNGSDVSDFGESVRLYQPISYKFKGHAQPTTSFMGGIPVYYSNHYNNKKKKDDDDDADDLNHTLQLPPTCQICHTAMPLLIQLHVPSIPGRGGNHNNNNNNNHGFSMNRSLHVFSCNRASCGYKVFSEYENQNDNDDNDKKKKKHYNFAVGGGGIVACRRSQQQQQPSSSSLSPPLSSSVVQQHTTTTQQNKNNDDNNKKPSPWGENVVAVVTPNEQDNDNDWDMDDNNSNDDDDDMEKMEAMLQEMEVNGPKGVGTTTTKKKKKDRTTTTANTLNNHDHVNPTTTSSVPQFTCFEIRATQEPAGRRTRTSGTQYDNGMDEDDNIGVAVDSDDKIQQMLARYMAEEDDEEILSALRGTTTTTTTAVGRTIHDELDEGLSDHDRAMLFFSDRVKRCPRQVVRYAKDGIPIWSIPPPPSSPKRISSSSWSSNNNNNKKRIHTNNNNKHDKVEEEDPLSVPNCPCGAKRIFEFQLMPSLLHALDVDQYALVAAAGGRSNHAKHNHADHDAFLNFEFMNGGQNWGTMAIYTCSESCEMNQDEFIILQNSMDGIPERRGDGGKMVVEVTMDDDDEDDEDDDNNE